MQQCENIDGAVRETMACASEQEQYQQWLAQINQVAGVLTRSPPGENSSANWRPAMRAA
jgi:AraC family transcriptional activator of tynA and feaB